MPTNRLNGADLHAEVAPAPAAPDPTRCWLAALESRRAYLTTLLRSLGIQVAGAEKLETTRENLVRLAELVAGADEEDLARLKTQIDAFDRETDQLAGEAEGRLRRARAQLEHRKNPSARGGLARAPEDLAALEAEAEEAERAAAGLPARRAAEREPLRREWLAAARRGLQSGLQLLALTEADLPALRDARDRAGAARRELDHLNTLAALAIAAEDRAAA